MDYSGMAFRQSDPDNSSESHSQGVRIVGDYGAYYASSNSSAQDFVASYKQHTPPIYPLTRQNSIWFDGTVDSSSLALAAPGSLCAGRDKFPEFDASDLTPILGAATAIASPGRSVTFSPLSSATASRTSSVDSVWSPVQTDFTADVSGFGPSSGGACSRFGWPSPLRHVSVLQEHAADDFRVGKTTYECPAPRCTLRFSTRQDLEKHRQEGHAHICLWGNRGPCDSAGFATREELNWHVKVEHLLECPVPGCSENSFKHRDVLDCHIRWDHGSTKMSDSQECRSNNLLETASPSFDTAIASESTPTEKRTETKPIPAEDRILKMEMSIGISKKRCRDQIKAVIEKRMKKTNGGSTRTAESPGTMGSRIPRLLDTASFPIIWEHAVLPFLIEFLPKWCGTGHIVSVTRGRKPNTRRICIMTLQPITRARRMVIAGHVLDLLPDIYRKTITFVFSTGKVNRLVWARGLGKEMPDEVCTPRNSFAYLSPCMGDSIGATLDSGDEVTATLGPCITVDSGSYWLASFHPFVGANQRTGPVMIEHPSPADRAQCLNERHDALNMEGLSFRVGKLTATSGFDLNTTRVSHDPYWEDIDKDPPLVVTDWILISADTRQANLLRKSPSTTQRRESPITATTSVTPGAIVCSTGRTSGFQKGQVCESPAYSLDPDDEDDAWIRGGIGVEGDSGAAIIDCDANTIIGQLWGRNKYFGPGPRLTYFTPISDVFDDIQERCGMQSRPQLPQYRDEADRFPVYPVWAHDVQSGEFQDVDLTSVSELATPKDHSHLLRHIGLDETGSSFGGVVSPAPVHAFYPISQALSPGATELRNPYAQALDEGDLYEAGCHGTSGVTLGKRSAVPFPLMQNGDPHSGKRQKLR
ncbi:hypothetical protein F5Y15DRAFT_411188 [Xylariaceae sp. FL0016]|nr:hypothetical protein F5Y15DRAFT_411188 [Xylariaceae sp. FL0016]